MKQKKRTGRRVLSFVLALVMVVGLMPGISLTAYAADEVSEDISLVASPSANLKTISGTHYSVSCGYMKAAESGMQVCQAGALTINARKGETITKVVLTYNWGNNKSSLSASAGTFDGNATISDINAQQVTISSSNTAGVKISAVRVYFEGDLNNPTVTLTGGANAKNSGGLLTQSYLPGAMDTVTYTALTGATFPEFETFTQNGVTVERTSDTVVTISGTPTANTEITVPDAESSSKIVTWDSSIINASGRNGIGYQIEMNNGYSDTANGITLTKSGSGYASLDYGDWMLSGDATLNFTTATGKFTSIEIETSTIYDGGNWTKVGNTLKWNGTPSNSVSLSGSSLYLSGVSSVNFIIEMPADLSNATVTLGDDNTVSSVTVGGNEITDLSEFDITYGTDESHTATEPPTEDGTYYAYVAPKDTSNEYTGTAKSAAFVVHTHNFGTSYALTKTNADNDTITATCSADGCPLNNKTATMTISPKSDGTATLKGDCAAFGVTDSNIVTTGESDGVKTASITVNGLTASISYSVSVVIKGTGAGNGCDFTVPPVATVGAKIEPELTLATGYEVKKITVRDGDTDVSETVRADKTGFIMPDYNVTVDVEFGKIDYKITKSSMAYGSVAVKNSEGAVITTAHYQDTITLDATPDNGFTLKSLTVKDSENADIGLSGTGNTHTFTMPASDVTVSATFEGVPFNLTISDEITGGTVTAAGSGVETADNATTAKAGSEVTLTVTPATGFQVDTVKYNDTIITASEGVYKFTMPIEDVTVTATFVGKPVTASLSVTGNTGTTCTAELLHDDFSAVTAEKPLTKKAGEKFILLVNRDEGYDFNAKFGSDNASLTEFTKEEYEAYVAYAKDNNITVSSNMVLAWVTMPGVTGDRVTLTVDFSKLQTFTILYQPTDNPDNVWCKFAVDSGVEGNNTASSQMKSDATMGDGSKVYSLKVTAGFDPKSVAFAATKDAVDAVTNDSMTACSTKTGTSDSDWTTIAGSGKFCVIGGDAKTVIVAFVSDANNMAVYNSDTVEVNEGTGTDGVTYRVAIVTDESAGTVKAPANTLTKEGYDFAGWRGFEGTATNKTEKIYNAGESISVSENTTLNAVWKLRNSTVTLNLNGGTGNSSVDPVTYGGKLPTLETPTRSGFAFDGWKVSKAVTENGVAFAKGSPFDLDTPITADLQLEAHWKHVHSYTCYRISAFGNALAAYAEYDSAIHVAVCGCNDIQLMAHEFDENGKCACGYQKPGAPDVKLNISYGQWSGGTYTEKMKGMPETAKQGQEVSICAPDAWGDLQFSKWQYSTDNSIWYDLTANDYVSFLIPATMYVRALYVNPVTVPQVDLSARQYDDYAVVNGQTYTMDNILFQMNYKLPDGYTFVDAGIRLGDNAGISYYELKERTYTANSETKALMKGFAALGVLVSTDPTTSATWKAGSPVTETFYEVHKNSVLDEMSAAELAKHMYESKPINVEKYDPIYWEAKAKTKGMSGSIATLPPLRFAQKDNQDHWIYGIGWLRYKDKAGNIQTIYTEALATTVNGVLKSNTGTVTKSGS